MNVRAPALSETPFHRRAPAAGTVARQIFNGDEGGGLEKWEITHKKCSNAYKLFAIRMQ
jgi:hypothetical protein